MWLELWLIGHVEEVFQLVPMALLAAGFLSLVWLAAAPSPWSVRAVQIVMALFLISGGVGIGLHYRGNEEFELEMYPDMSGVELAKKALSGATPVLAPGSMSLLGLVGLAVAHRHPADGYGHEEVRYE
jgi:hypothetical protein